MATNNELKKIKNHLHIAEDNLRKVWLLVATLEKQLPKPHEALPGVVGVFDGIYMITSSGDKYEVAANYAAKSMLIFGDSLKMLDQDGRHVFKQVEKLPRAEIEGVLSKKEGKWYLLASSGTYKISDVAANFHAAKVNDTAVALVPAGNKKVSFAALKSVTKEHTPKATLQDSPAPTTPVEISGEITLQDNAPVASAKRGKVSETPTKSKKSKTRAKPSSVIQVNPVPEEHAAISSVPLDVDDLR